MADVFSIDILGTSTNFSDFREINVLLEIGREGTGGFEVRPVNTYARKHTHTHTDTHQHMRVFFCV